MALLLKHHLRAAAPLLVCTGLVAGAARLGVLAKQLASADVTAGLLGALGEGVDEFGVRAGLMEGQLTPLFTDSGNWIAAVAIAATGISLASALRRLSDWIHEPEDAVAIARHVMRRAVDAIGMRAIPVRWGIVRDVQTGSALPFTRVCILDERGSVLAHTVADSDGSYGFHEHPSQLRLLTGSISLCAFKGGYHHTVVAQPVRTVYAPDRSDIAMSRLAWMSFTGRPTTRTLGRIVGFVSFWGGVATVPLVFLAVPSPAGLALTTMFGFSALIRAIGSGTRA